MPFYVIGGLWVLYKYRLQGLLILVLAGLTILLSDQTSGILKAHFMRLRPCAVMDVRLLVEHCSNTYSFTSNHAANHFAIAVFVSLVFGRYRWLSYVLISWAAFVALSQVYVGLHYPADIAGGALLGSMVGCLTFLIFKLIKQKYFAKSLI